MKLRNSRMDGNTRTVLAHADLYLRNRFYKTCHFRLPVSFNFATGRYVCQLLNIIEYVKNNFTVARDAKINVTSKNSDPVYGSREFFVDIN